jgi:hypothetical protein
MPISLTARLLCAARQSYTITAAGPVPDAPHSDQIGYLSVPDGFATGLDRIEAGLVGEAADGIIVAFRGTLPPESPDRGQMILDWASDCDALLVTDPGGLPGKVHQGFLAALDSLWPAIGPAITARNLASPTKPIYVTGHSKGGAIANLAALRLRKTLPGATPILVGTFAAARSGDPDFATAYAAAIAHCARYEYQDDIVPHLPPSDEFLVMFRNVPFIAGKLPHLTPGYAAVGELHFIDWNGQLVGDSPTLRFERFVHLARLMAGFGFATIVDDHAIDPGSGYDKALYP